MAVTLLDVGKRFIRGINDAEQIKILFGNHAALKKTAAEPRKKRFPELTPDQYDRNPANLMSLNQRQRLRKLIQRSEAAGINQKSNRIFQKTDLRPVFPLRTEKR